MYKITGELLSKLKNNINNLLNDWWLESESTPEEFSELANVIEARRLIKLLEENYEL